MEKNWVYIAYVQTVEQLVSVINGKAGKAAALHKFSDMFSLMPEISYQQKNLEIKKLYIVSTFKSDMIRNKEKIPTCANLNSTKTAFVFQIISKFFRSNYLLKP